MSEKPQTALQRARRLRLATSASAKPVPREVVLDRLPMMQLDIYDTSIIVTRRTAIGGWTSYPVSRAGIAQVLSGVPSSSGLLPPGALASGRVHGRPFFVMLIPARLHLLQFASAEPREVPMPPLIWAGCGEEFRIFALATDRHPVIQEPLMHAPLANVGSDGAICWGSVRRRPVASTEGMLRALALFMTESAFNDHMAGGKSKRQRGNINLLYPKLDPAAAYPLDDLIPSNRLLEWLVTGQVWGAR